MEKNARFRIDMPTVKFKTDNPFVQLFFRYNPLIAYLFYSYDCDCAEEPLVDPLFFVNRRHYQKNSFHFYLEFVELSFEMLLVSIFDFMLTSQQMMHHMHVVINPDKKIRILPLRRRFCITL